jgi:hypothetical protein
LELEPNYIIKNTVKIQFNSVHTHRPLVSWFLPERRRHFGLSGYGYECATFSGEGHPLGGQQQDGGSTLEHGTSEEEESFLSTDAHI